MAKQIDFNNLTYYFMGLNKSPINFNRFKVPMRIYNDIKIGETSVEKIEADQKQFKSDLNQITIGNPKYNGEYQSNTITNIKNFYNSRQRVIDLFNGYAKITLKLCIKENREQELKYQLLNKCFKDY